MVTILRDGKPFNSKLSQRDREQFESSEQRQHLIEKATRRAEAAEREQGHEAPDIIYESFQRDDVYTHDTDFDSSRAALEGRTSLPVKQYRIKKDGTLEKELGPAALEAVRQGIFCARCEERQPESEHRKRESWKRMKDLGVVPVGGSPSEDCAYCGSRLGMHGDAAAGLSMTTPEQQEMIAHLRGA